MVQMEIPIVAVDGQWGSSELLCSCRLQGSLISDADHSEGSPETYSGNTYM